MTIWARGDDRRMVVEPRLTGGYRLHAQMAVPKTHFWKTLATIDFNDMADINLGGIALLDLWSQLTGEI